MTKYMPAKFESKWIKNWDKKKIYKTESVKDKKKKKYILVMFPYPSGSGLHVGHVRIYTGTDVIARYFRMKGYSVLHPIGWDAFGLPAENAAIKAKKNPQDLVPRNQENFKRQMKMIGLSYDWDRELSTADPNYYAITQWLFIQFFKLGLLYKTQTPVYFCPFCKTGLAEEEVLPDGTHERCGKPITRKLLPQWIFKITDYGDSLLKTLNTLDWPKGILEMQKNWIGRKEGIEITYDVVQDNEKVDTITCFTTRPDTNFGATFIVIAPEHKFVTKILQGKIKVDKKTKEKVDEYVKKSLAKTDLDRIAEGKEKTGVFTGFYAVNNLNGRKMPVWISDFVLSEFGTGAVVGVPGHDVRDFQFAKKFGIEIIRVVKDKDGNAGPIKDEKDVQEDEGIMINSEFLNGLNIHKATKVMMDYLEKKGWGERKVSYHLRDWIFSRQRYWGEPIPMVYCEHCAKKGISWYSLHKNDVLKKEYQSNTKLYQNITERWGKNSKDMAGWFPIEEKSLPLKLPYVDNYKPSATGQSPLAHITEWTQTKCPVCGRKAVRETDTMPNWAGSCWYFLAFTFWNKEGVVKKKGEQVSRLWANKVKNSVKKWMPVDWYVGGAEHAVLHLLYSRFWVHALNDMNLVNFREPFMKLSNVGMVLAGDHKKMSKSLGNVINPDDVVKEFGADALRIYEMFMAPFDQEIAWSNKALQGAYRFLKKIWQIYHSIDNLTNNAKDEDKDLLAKLQTTIAKVEQDITNVKFNTAIAKMMEFVNEWTNKKLSEQNAKKFLKVLSPFAPFITEEIWQSVFEEKESIHLSTWPKVVIKTTNLRIKIPIQVDGKVRDIITINKEMSEKAVIEIAMNSQKIQKYLKNKKFKYIYIKNKIINFVLLKK